jgi:hypothetical protein
MHREPKSAAFWYRVLRPASLVLVLVVIVYLGPPWLRVVAGDPRVRRIVPRLLLALQAVHGALMAALPIAIGGPAIGVWRARRRGIRRPWLARGLALCVALASSLMLAEVTAAAWLAWQAHLAARLLAPARSDSRAAAAGRGWPPARWLEQPDDDAVDIVIVGESSAGGFPYGDRFSPAEIVAWKLREAIPDRRFRVALACKPGITLEIAHGMLSEVERRPDLVIVYAGHNEMDARFYWNSSPAYYLDETPAAGTKRTTFSLPRSPLSCLIQQVIDNRRVASPPPPNARRPLVDVPAFTPADYAGRLRDFRARLEAITDACERLGALVVLVPPPANDADFEPNRSYLRPETARSERQEFARAFEAARSAEAADPGRAIADYRALLERQPGFAEAHYRLARLLEADGRRDEAERHYIAARDDDGYSIRCMTEFLHAYAEVAARHPRAILIDARALFRKLSPRGLLEYACFSDAHHPSLPAYTALARAVLEQLRARRAFGWPASSPTPIVTAAGCVAHFGMDPEQWAELCDSISEFYSLAAPIRPDASDRLARSERYQEAARRIRGGLDPERVHLPSIGTGGPAGDADAVARGRAP